MCGFQRHYTHLVGASSGRMVKINALYTVDQRMTHLLNQQLNHHVNKVGYPVVAILSTSDSSEKGKDLLKIKCSNALLRHTRSYVESVLARV